MKRSTLNKMRRRRARGFMDLLQKAVSIGKDVYSKGKQAHDIYKAVVPASQQAAIRDKIRQHTGLGLRRRIRARR